MTRTMVLSMEISTMILIGMKTYRNPNKSAIYLSLDVDILPKELSIANWKDGLIYAMTLTDEKKTSCTWEW